VELEAESKAHRTWTPVLQTQAPEETVAIATFQWRRVPLTRPVITRLLAIAAVIVVGCGVLAYGVSAMGTKTYGARSEVLFPISAEIASGGFLRSDRTLQTQLETIKSRAVLEPVASRYGLTFDQLSKQVVASVLSDSEVIRIEVDDASQRKANAMVGDVTEEYLANAVTKTGSHVEQRLNEQLRSLQGQQRSLTDDLAAAQQARFASADPNTPSAQETQLQAQLDGVNERINNTQTQLDDNALNEIKTENVKTLTSPYDVGKVAPKPLRAGLAGALAGMMIAAGVVVLLIRRRLKQMPLDQFG
jgi:capsular polysaccharide biosynthesis protein